MSSKTNIILRFLRWYFVHEPMKIAKSYKAYAKALFEIVPFGFLLLTLFAPWKNIQGKRTEHGINLERIFERMSLNLLTRATGFVVRTLTILLGLFFQVLLITTTLLHLAMWYGAPLWIPFAVHTLITLTS